MGVPTGVENDALDEDVDLEGDWFTGAGYKNILISQQIFGGIISSVHFQQLAHM